MENILRGIRRFQREIYPQRESLFRGLARGQQPEALFITCSDSRIDPAMVTQIDPGTLFVVRNAGNIVPPYGVHPGGTAASLEYAVCVLKVKHIVVCGHSHCGAIRELVNPESLEELPHVQRWIAHAEAISRMLEAPSTAPLHERVWRAVQANVLLQLAHVRTFPMVAQRVAAGELTLHGWAYDFEHGEMYVHDRQNAFVPLSSVDDSAPDAYAQLAGTVESVSTGEA